MEQLNEIVTKIDDFVWGPVMLILLVGTGNIVDVATAMVSGGPGALVWMWISATFGLTSKFSEFMLSKNTKHFPANHFSTRCFENILVSF